MPKSKLQQQLEKAKVRSLSDHKPIPVSGQVSVMPSPERAPKLSVSLYQRDLQRLDEIRAFMQQKGVRRLSDSEALRLACRGVELGDHLVDAYRQMQAEDGRRKTIES